MAWLALVVGCEAPAPEGEHDEPACSSDFLDLSREEHARGLLTSPAAPGNPRASFGGGIVAEDLDGDGDIDVSFVSLLGEGTVFANDGSGTFDAVPSVDLTGPPVFGHAAVEVTGDALPDLILASQNMLFLAINLGDLAFAEPQPLGGPLTPDRRVALITVAAGDADGDGDLDLFAPGLMSMDGDQPDVPGAPDMLLLNRGDGFGPPIPIESNGPPSQSFAALWTDRDLDGDADLMVTSVGDGVVAPTTRFLRNDGLDPQGIPRLVDETAEVAGGVAASPMGIALADLNGDGLDDICFADMGPVPCLVSDPSGVYVEAGAAHGLLPEIQDRLIGWSLELEDLDNDGARDAVMAAGHSAASWLAVEQGWTDHPDYVPEHPDTLWRGQRRDGELHFEDRSAKLGFGDTVDHYGLATADFDGNGTLDLLLSGNDEPAALYMNTCATHSWIEVELEGPAGNAQGLGARVSVLAGGRWQTREVLGPRAYGQGPSRAHFGLGTAEEVDAVEILWPDGTWTEGGGATARQVLHLAQ